jgi:hypothetical protein
MKLFLGMFIFLITSMSPLPEEFVLTHQCVPEKEISCVVDTSFVCPPGYIDGCVTEETKKHECVLINEGPSCEVSMDLKCPENFEDGCLSGETDHHLCVPAQGQLCTENIDYSCPSGFVDSCLQ